MAKIIRFPLQNSMIQRLTAEAKSERQLSRIMLDSGYSTKDVIRAIKQLRENRKKVEKK